MAADIVITGLGVVSPIGIGRAPFAESLWAGRSGVGPLTRFDPSALAVRIAAEVQGYDAAQYVKPRKSLKLMSRDIMLSYGAAKLASEDAGLTRESIDPERLGVVFGADMMYCELPELVPVFLSCIEDGVFIRSRWGEMCSRELNPLWMLKYLPNMPACHIGIAHDARGPNNSITQGEASSLLALAEGVRTIARGAADVMIVGGGSSRLHPTPLLSRSDEYVSHRNDSPAAAARPFDAQRDGMVNGEGSAAFVIERRSIAESRGARILARVLGFSACFEPGSIGTCPTGTALRGALRTALAAAELQPKEIGHVNAHGLSTVPHDRMEAQAIHAELGDVPVTAPKSFFGNLGAGTGAVEMAASVLALESGKVPATLNYEKPDPQCPVCVVHGGPLKAEHNTALVINYTTLGQATAVVLAGAQ